MREKRAAYPEKKLKYLMHKSTLPRTVGDDGREKRLKAIGQ